MRSTSSRRAARSSSSASTKSTSTTTRSNRKNRVEASQFLEKLVGKLTLAKVIRSTRQGDELSQQEFADKLGISKQHLCDIEKGRKVVSPARAWEWAKKLGYHPKQWLELALEDMLEKEGLKGMKVRLDVA